MLRVGEPVPSFTMPSTRNLQRLDEPVSSDMFRGRWLFLVFYPGDFTFVCPTELSAIGERYADFQRRGADVIGVSTDSVFSHRAWLDTPPERHGLGPIPFPLASDATGAVSGTMGLLRESTHQAERATVLIDPDGVVRWIVVHHPDIGRSVDEMLRVLDAAQTGSLCPVDWHPGAPVLTI